MVGVSRRLGDRRSGGRASLGAVTPSVGRRATDGTVCLISTFCAPVRASTVEATKAIWTVRGRVSIYTTKNTIIPRVLGS